MLLRVVATLTVSVGAIAFVIVAAPSPAMACSVVNTDHCYGEAITQPPGSIGGIDGIEATTFPTCSLWVPNGSFITDEVWLASSDGSYWVEVGYMYNETTINGLQSGSQAFWFDSRPGGGAHGHVLAVNPSLTGAFLRIAHNTQADQYQADFGAGLRGYSTNNSMAPAVGIVGSESTSNTGHSYSYFDDMERHHSGGSWTTGGLYNPMTAADPPQQFIWSTYPRTMHAGSPC